MAALRDDDIRLGTFHDREQLRLFRRGDFELVERGLKILEKRHPFVLGDLEVFVRFGHRAAGVRLRSAGRPAPPPGVEAP